MSGELQVTAEAIERLYQRLKAQATATGYNLNPDDAAVKGLLRGLLVNEARHGYQACPCRLAFGIPDEDRDIICPCDYRDADLDEHGACYCGLYVSGAVARGEATVGSIPERRGSDQELKPAPTLAVDISETDCSARPRLPVWRCQVCGYLCGRSNPPELCPICKVKRDRFERFM